MKHVVRNTASVIMASTPRHMIPQISAISIDLFLICLSDNLLYYIGKLFLYDTHSLSSAHSDTTVMYTNFTPTASLHMLLHQLTHSAAVVACSF